MASTTPSDLNIENKNINTAPGVDLSPHQKTLIGSVLDLFAGRPSLAKLQLWTDDAEFQDPIALAKGRKEFEAQWYGLQTAFSEIERLRHEVTSGGNPIEMDLKTRYVVKGIGKEQVIESVVRVFTEGERISKVEDRWNGKLPESAVADVSRCFSLVVEVGFVGGEMWPWRALFGVDHDLATPLISAWPLSNCVSRVNRLLTSYLTGFPKTQRPDDAESRRRAQERGGGQGARQLSVRHQPCSSDSLPVAPALE